MNTASRPERASGGVREALMLTSTAAVVNMGFLFLETTLAARLVSTSQFGLYVLVVAVVNLAMMLVDFGSKTAVTQLIARSEGPTRAALVSSALVFRCGVIVALSVLAWLSRDLLALFEPARDLLPYLDHVPAMVLVASVDQLLFGMLQGFQAYRPLAAAQILRSVLRLGLTVVLIGAFGMGVPGLLYSWTVSFGLSALYQYFSLPVARSLKIDRRLLAELLHFGVPLQFAGFLWFVFSRVQTFILAAFAGPVGVAQFAVASRIPEALQQVGESYMAVYFPKMTVLLAERRHVEASRMLATSLRLVSFCAAVLALTCVLLSVEMTELLFSTRYSASAPAFAVMMVALHMVLVVNLMGYTLTSAGHPKRSLVVDVVRTGAVLIASLALVPPLGFMGATYARLLSSYSGGPVVVALLQRSGQIVRVAAIFKQTAILLVCSGLALYTQAAGVPAKLGIAIIFVLLSATLGGISLTDLSFLVPVGAGWPRRSPRVPVNPPRPVGD